MEVELDSPLISQPVTVTQVEDTIVVVVVAWLVVTGLKVV